MPGPEEAKVFVHKTCVLHSTIMAIAGIQNAIPLIHGPIHCTYHYKVFTEMFLGSKIRLVCSGLTESDVIFGAVDKLRLAIQETYKRYRPELIGVITTCAADLMGEDVDGVISEVANGLVSCDVVHVPSGGFRGGKAGPNQGYGYHLAYDALVGLMEASDYRIENSVNILGHIHPPGKGQDINEIIRPLRRMGVRINCVMTAGSRLCDIKRVPEAQLNVVRCENNARRTAELLEARFGMPWVSAKMAPVGTGAMSDWLMATGKALGMEARARGVVAEERRSAQKALEPVRAAVEGKRGAVFLSPGKSLAVSRFLYEDLGVRPVAIYMLHYNEWVIDTIKEMVSEWDFVPEILIEPEYSQVIATLEDLEVEIALGGTIEKQICKSMGIPYVHEMVYQEPHHGYQGAVKLGQEILDSVTAALWAEARVDLTHNVTEVAGNVGDHRL
ncbi:MAG: nitrogenase component 1 [Anaerolineae bacterium]